MGFLFLLGIGAAAYLISKHQQPTSIPASNVDAATGKLISDAVASNDPFFTLDAIVKLFDHPQIAEPQMAQALQILLNKVNQAKPSKEITAGRAGHRYRLQLVQVFPDKTLMWDVFTLPGSRILRFRQSGELKAFVTSPEGVDPAIVKSAKEDFQIG